MAIWERSQNITHEFQGSPTSCACMTLTLHDTPEAVRTEPRGWWLPRVTHEWKRSKQHCKIFETELTWEPHVIKGWCGLNVTELTALLKQINKNFSTVLEQDAKLCNLIFKMIGIQSKIISHRKEISTTCKGKDNRQTPTKVTKMLKLWDKEFKAVIYNHAARSKGKHSSNKENI